MLKEKGRTSFIWFHSPFLQSFFPRKLFSHHISPRQTHSFILLPSKHLQALKSPIKVENHNKGNGKATSFFISLSLEIFSLSLTFFSHLKEIFSPSQPLLTVSLGWKKWKTSSILKQGKHFNSLHNFTLFLLNFSPPHSIIQNKILSLQSSPRNRELRSRRRNKILLTSTENQACMCKNS